MPLCKVGWTKAVTLKSTRQSSENMRQKGIEGTRENTQTMTCCLWNWPWASKKFGSHEAWDANRPTVKQGCCIWWDFCALTAFCNEHTVRIESSSFSVLHPEAALHSSEHTFSWYAPQIACFRGCSFFRRAIFFSLFFQLEREYFIVICRNVQYRLVVVLGWRQT